MELKALEWKKDRSKKPKRITSDSRGIIFFKNCRQQKY